MIPKEVPEEVLKDLKGEERRDLKEEDNRINLGIDERINERRDFKGDLKINERINLKISDRRDNVYNDSNVKYNDLRNNVYNDSRNNVNDSKDKDVLETMIENIMRQNEEPTQSIPYCFDGCIHKKEQCILLMSMAYQGLLPMVNCRLKSSQKRRIRPGMVFVYCEKESKITRWTDDGTWSPSRVSGCFLAYKDRTSGTIKRTFTLKAPEGTFRLVSYSSISDESNHDCLKSIVKFEGLIRKAGNLRLLEGLPVQPKYLRRPFNELNISESNQKYYMNDFSNANDYLNYYVNANNYVNKNNNFNNNVKYCNSRDFADFTDFQYEKYEIGDILSEMQYKQPERNLTERNSDFIQENIAISNNNWESLVYTIRNDDSLLNDFIENNDFKNDLTDSQLEEQYNIIHRKNIKKNK